MIGRKKQFTQVYEVIPFKFASKHTNLQNAISHILTLGVDCWHSYHSYFVQRTTRFLV